MSVIDTEHLAVLPAADATASASGAQIDVRDFEGVAAFVLDSAADAGGDGTLDVALEQSDDGATWVAVPGGAFTQVTAAGPAFERLIVDLDRLGRYIRATETIAGTAPSFARSLTMTAMKKYR